MSLRTPYRRSESLDRRDLVDAVTASAPDTVGQGPSDRQVGATIPAGLCLLTQA
jgi:hypothetical protein